MVEEVPRNAVKCSGVQPRCRCGGHSVCRAADAWIGSVARLAVASSYAREGVSGSKPNTTSKPAPATHSAPSHGVHP